MESKISRQIWEYNNPMEIKRKKTLEKVLKKNISYRNHYLQFKDPKICEFLAKAGLFMILLSVIIIVQDSGIEYSNLQFI